MCVFVMQEDVRRRTSAPPSLAASRENLLEKSSRSSTPSLPALDSSATTPAAVKRFSADLSKLDEIHIAKYAEPPAAAKKKGNTEHVFVSQTVSSIRLCVWMIRPDFNVLIAVSTWYLKRCQRCIGYHTKGVNDQVERP